MNKHPKVSIITVVYNGVAHLEQTIQNVLKQSYDNIEYIIIDGGSIDGTVEIIKRYADRVSYWVSEADGGIYDAMNKGIANATGEIVGLINADDWYEVDAVEKVVQIFESREADVVHGGMFILKEDGEGFVKTAVSDLSNLSKGMLLNHPTVFAKRSLYEKYGGFDTSYRIVADWEMMMRWKLRGVKFSVLDETLANFRMGGVSSEHLKKSFEEKHDVRKRYDTYGTIDWYYIYDRLKSILPAEKLLDISLKKQKKKGLRVNV